MTYESILDFWKKQNIKNANKLASVLSSYSVNFAYNSGKQKMMKSLLNKNYSG